MACCVLLVWLCQQVCEVSRGLTVFKGVNRPQGVNSAQGVKFPNHWQFCF